MQEEQVHTARWSSPRSNEAADLGMEHRTPDQEDVARLAYFYGEKRVARTIH